MMKKRINEAIENNGDMKAAAWRLQSKKRS